MKNLAKLGVVACLTVASVAPVASQAGATTTPASHRVAATRGFVPVGTTSFVATSIASPTDGVAYVAGVDRAGKLHVQHYTRTNAGVRMRDIPVPASKQKLYGPVQLAASSGHTYLTVPGAGLFEITAKGLCPLPAVPAVDPHGQRVSMTPDKIVADGPNSLWAAAGGGATARQTFHWDGRTWTATAVQVLHPSVSFGDMFAKAGHVFQLAKQPSAQTTRIDEWDGSKWQPARIWSAGPAGDLSAGTAMTFAGLGDITYWGTTTPRAGSSRLSKNLGFRGLCERAVGDKVTPCPAPKWGVNAAVRLLDGRVVLGGVDGTYEVGRVKSKVEGRFAVVPRTGANPVNVPGDPGDGTLGLAAATQGTTVWALTKSGSRTTVQVMNA